MNAPTAPEALPFKLHCLGGQAPPQEIVADFLGLRRLPQGAVSAIWEVLVLCLGDEMTKPSQATLDGFSAEHQADGAVLARVLKASRFFVRQAAAHDLSPAVFAEDLMAILDGDEPLTRILVGGYEATKAALRTELMRQSLGDHGKVLERVDWRADYLTASSRGERFRMPYVTLTFTHREGDTKGRTSLQMPREAVAQLRALCDKILSD